jgi:hypothetical protein
MRRLTRRRLACALVEVAEIAPGLYRWTARHPEWRPGAEPESPGDWPPEVGSVAYLAPDALVTIDPLLPSDEDAFWSWLDGLASSRDRVVTLTTLQWHRRDRDRLVERYGASTSRAARALPDGVEAIPIRGAGETMFWIEEHRALVPGDRLLGDGRDGLRLCPDSWLVYLKRPLSVAQLRSLLRPLLELPIEAVLVSHGEPVLEGGRQALARAVGARWASSAN